MTSVQPTGRGKWEIFKSWWLQETFWREMTTRTASALLAAFVIWGVAVAVGAFQSPDVVNGFGNLLELIVIVLALVSFYLQLMLAVSKRPARASVVNELGNPPRWLLMIGALGTLGFGITVMLDFITRISGGKGFFL